jgi:hypothetical protein
VKSLKLLIVVASAAAALAVGLGGARAGGQRSENPREPAFAVNGLRF